MTAPSTQRRESMAGKRQIRHALGVATAAEAIGDITPECEIYGLSKGQFSLVDIITHCLATTGPADVVIATWTAAGADLGFAHKLMTDGAIRSCRFVVDFSFQTRQPAYCAALRERFGDDAIRVTKTHAKFVTIRNDRWNLVVRSSMNLNENRRLESFEISDSVELAEYLAAVNDDLFATHAPGEQFAKGAYRNCLDFEALGSDEKPTAEQASANVRRTAATVFGDAPLSVDVRRAGLTNAKGIKLT